jgi:hypothetical protein
MEFTFTGTLGDDKDAQVILRIRDWEHHTRAQEVWMAIVDIDLCYAEEHFRASAGFDSDTFLWHAEQLVQFAATPQGSETLWDGDSRSFIEFAAMTPGKDVTEEQARDLLVMSAAFFTGIEVQEGRWTHEEELRAFLSAWNVGVCYQCFEVARTEVARFAQELVTFLTVPAAGT